MIFFPEDSTAVPDTPKLMLIILDPERGYDDPNAIREQLAGWMRARGESPRLYPGALIWCLRKPGRALRDRIEHWLAWKHVAEELASGILGGDFEAADRAQVSTNVREAEDAAREEVWADYRFALLLDPEKRTGLKLLDLGAGHASAADTLSGGTGRRGPSSTDATGRG